MNKKGFTTVELILTVILVVIIMGTVTGVTYTYRDRSNYEETLTEVINYKNTLTKIIYDDILNPDNKAIKLTKSDESNYLINLTNDDSILLSIINDEVNKKMGIKYKEIEYLVPGSSDELIKIEEVNFKEDTVNNLYSLEIIFTHRNLEENFKIRFVIA